MSAANVTKPVRSTYGYLARYVGVHQPAHPFARIVMPEQEHQFCYGAFNCCVTPVDNAGFKQLHAGAVSFHFYCPLATLRYTLFSLFISVI